MSNSKLYQPPPPPPKQALAPVDPLLALSKAPTVIAPAAEDLTDLTDDAGLEEWASSGTKVMPKSQMTPHPPMASAPLPSYFPVAYSTTAPRIQEKRTSAAIWVVPLALFVFAIGAVAAAAGWYVYHTRDLVSASTVDTSSNVVVPPVATETPPPAVTLTATTTPAVVSSAALKTTAAPTTTSTIIGTSSKRIASASTNTMTSTSTSTSTGALRTFAAGNGKPVFVDGKQVGYGGAKITTVCGRHNVSVGTGHARSVEIPCNGPTITVGTPDGM